MKRDMNLALAILKTLEENKAPHLSEFDIEAALKAAFDVPNRGIGYHLNLMADANFVRSMGNDWRLTWAGHDFLKTAVPTPSKPPEVRLSTLNLLAFMNAARVPVKTQNHQRVLAVCRSSHRSTNDERACTSSHLVSYQRPDGHSWTEGTMDRLSDALLQYHDRSKHRVNRYAPGPHELDWIAQPNPFREFHGAPRVNLLLAADTFHTRYNEVRCGALPSAYGIDLRNLSILFELSLGLSAWKSIALRVGRCAAILRVATSIRPRAI